jgi:hypothetical protein
MMNGNWIKFIYERNIYVVKLSQISSFACPKNGRLMFWLPDGKELIVIHQLTNPDAYQQILDYVNQRTGQSLSGDLSTGLVKHPEKKVIKSDDSS